MRPLFFSVQFRLLLLCSGFIVSLGGATLVLGALIQQDEGYQRAQQEQFRRVKVIASVQEGMTSFRHARGLLNSNILLKNEREAKAATAALQENGQRVLRLLDDLSAFDPANAALITQTFAELPPLNERLLAILVAGQSVDASADLAAYQSRLNLINDTLNAISTREHQLSDQVELKERARVANAIQTARIVVLAATVIGSLLTLLLVRSIIRPLRATTLAIQQVNAGETRIDLPAATRDEFGAVATALRQFRDRAESLHRLAFEDPLTGLGNRAQLDETLRWTVEDARRQQRHLVLFYLDLDNFRSVNDRFGHRTGDRYIAEAASRLRRFIPDGATLYRYGGDNFVVLLDNLDEAEIAPARLEGIAQILLRGLSEHYVLDEQLLNMSASAGISVFPADGATAEELLSSADSAMYSAKRNGRAHARFAGTEQTGSLRRQLSVYSDIRRGIERNEFRVYYQPVVDSRARRVIGAEALLRWQHPTRGLVYPRDFIAASEESGLITRLGEFCLLQAEAQSRLWRQADLHLRIAVNLSIRQLTDERSMAVVRSVAPSGSRDADIEFELTESVLLESSTRGEQALTEIHDLGYRLSLDDFGIGYSSFGYLERLPISKIKIDRQFVANLDRSPRTHAIVTALLALSAGLKLDVVSEGVETQVQADLLRTLGCDVQQGFLYAQAMPPDEFLAWTHDYEGRRQHHPAASA